MNMNKLVMFFRNKHKHCMFDFRIPLQLPMLRNCNTDTDIISKLRHMMPTEDIVKTNVNVDYTLYFCMTIFGLGILYIYNKHGSRR